MDSSHLSIGASVSKLLRSLDWIGRKFSNLTSYISYRMKVFSFRSKNCFFHLFFLKTSLLYNRRMGRTGDGGEGFRIFEHIFSLNKRTFGRLGLFKWIFRFPGWPSFIEVLCFQNSCVSGKMITVLRNRLLVIRSLISFPLESGNFFELICALWDQQNHD